MYHLSEAAVQRDQELLIGAALLVPIELADIVHRLVKRTEVVQFGQRALHQFGILTEQLARI